MDTRGGAVRPHRPPWARPIPVTQLGAFLLGEWEVDRRIDDAHEASPYRFSGRGSFVARRDDGLDYQEAGVLSRGTLRSPAERHLVVLAFDGGRARVTFADGRPFYNLDLSRGRWRAVHPCAPDLYTLVCVVDGPDSFVEQWRVRGPDKSYRSVTRFIRRARPPTATAAAEARHRARGQMASGACTQLNWAADGTVSSRGGSVIDGNTGGDA